MITVSEAKKIINKLSLSLSSLEKKLDNALNDTLAINIHAPIMLPSFNQSAMDGYALHLDTTSKTYTIIDEIQAGSSKNPILKKGEAVRIFTGAAVPSSANAVIMQEKTTATGNQLTIDYLPPVGKNIRYAGEQIQKGDLALSQGTVLTPAAIGFLAGLGIETVTVYSKPSIALLITGNELVQRGQALEHGQIYESNGCMLKAVIEQTGFEVTTLQMVPDDYEQTKHLLKTQLANHDFVIVSGGISVGDYDFVGKALLELNTKQLFYKIRQKPGKPMFLGQKDKSFVFALPGNPASALSCYYQYVLTALKRAAGQDNFALKTLFLPLDEQYIKKGNRAHFLKAQLTDTGVRVLNKQSSAMLHSFAQADAMVYIPEEQLETLAGQLVKVYLLP